MDPGPTRRIAGTTGVHFVRHFVRDADDFIVTGATREILEQKVKPALTDFLKSRGLRLSEQKTVITHTQEGFDFLGHTVRKFGEKLLTKPSKSNVQALRPGDMECPSGHRSYPDFSVLQGPVCPNAHQWIRSVKTEVLSRMILFGERSLRQCLTLSAPKRREG